MQRFSVSKNKLPILAGLLIIVIAVALVLNRPSHLTDSNTLLPTPTPSPGSPGNPGDAAKSNTPTPSPQSKATPSASASPTSGIQVSIDTITPRSDGTLRVANTITGATSGTCTLELTDPDGQKTTVNGTIDTSGSSFFCSLGTISAVTKIGTWSAKLTATSNGASGFQVTTFSKAQQ